MLVGLKSKFACIHLLLIAMAISAAALAIAPVSIAAEGAPMLSDLLEQAAYQQGTANNPERAIKLYRQVIESEKATRQMIAQALYNTGLCYAKLKQKSEADQAFGAVVSQYKNVEPYYRLANARLNPTFTPASPRWQDGERLEYESRSKNDDEIRNYFWTTTTKVTWNGRAAWKLLNRSLGNNGLSMVIVDEKTLRPLYSRAHNPTYGTSTATWTDNSISVSRDDQEGAKESTFEGVVYDGEQQFWLLRQGDMTPGSRAKYPLLPSLLTEKPIPFEITVMGEEQIQLPAGQFAAYKLSPNDGLSNIWIDKGPERYLLKVGSPGSRMELKRITRVTPNTWRTVASAKSNFSFSIPDEWFDATKMGESKYPATKTIDGKTERTLVTVPREEIYALGDDINVRIRLFITDVKALSEFDDFDSSLAGRAAIASQQQERGLKNFVERADAKINRTIGNLPALSTIGDFQERNEEMVVYATYLMRDTKTLWVACITPKGQFNELKPLFDRVLNTIRF